MTFVASYFYFEFFFFFLLFSSRKSPLKCACAAGGACGSSNGKVFLFGPRKESSLALIPLVNNRFLSALISVSSRISSFSAFSHTLTCLRRRQRVFRRHKITPLIRQRRHHGRRFRVNFFGFLRFVELT